MNKSNRIRYYESESDDFFQVGEEYKLEDGYEYISKNLIYRVFSEILYHIALVISSLYCRLFLHVRFEGCEKLRKQKGGFFIYGNHTQPVGDVFDPAIACFPKRIYTVVSVANMHLPFIGKILRPLGALPLPDTLSETKKFNSAVRQRISEGHPVMIYPEAHLWEYYSGVRRFPASSFTYPVSLNIPVYALTATYQSRGKGKKPRITVYADGPFYAEGNSRKEKMQYLHDAVYTAMCARVKAHTNCEYIKYVKKE